MKIPKNSTKYNNLHQRQKTEQHHHESSFRLDAFQGILGGTPMLWRMAGLAPPAHAAPSLLTQSAHWLAAVRRSPACVDPTVGNVGKARAMLAARIASWPATKLSRIP